MARQRVTQATIAAALGTSQQAVSARLNGRVAFDVNELALVATILKVDSAELLTPAGARGVRSAS